jgi:ABC-type glutathione transport system ATPase component
MNAALAAIGLGKIYRRRRGWFASPAETQALADVSLSLAPAEILGIVGESGCGKSTLAKVLVGLVAPDHGEIAIDGVPILGPGIVSVPAARRGIQMVFQDPFGALDPRMRVQDIVGEGL